MITFVVTWPAKSGKEEIVKKAYVSNDKFHGEAIKGMMSSEYSTNTEDLTIYVPLQYNPVIGNYINFLHGKPTEITTVSKLSECFVMNIYFLDPNYFNYLMSQLLIHWTSNKLYGVLDAITIPGLVDDICLHLPFNLLPDNYKLQPNFVKDWFATTGNKDVLQDDDTKIVSEVTYQKAAASLSGWNNPEDPKTYTELLLTIWWPANSHPTTTTQTTGATVSSVIYAFYPDYHLREEVPISYRDRMYANLRTFIYAPSVVRYDEGVRDGQERHWFENGELASKADYQDGELTGHYISYLDDGTRLEEGGFVNTKREGEWYEYNKYLEMYSLTTYKDGQQNGERKEYTMNRVLIAFGPKINGQAEGIWHFRDLQHHTVSTGEMCSGQKCGRWPFYDDRTNKLLYAIYYDYGRVEATEDEYGNVTQAESEY